MAGHKPQPGGTGVFRHGAPIAGWRKYMFFFEKIDVYGCF
jgi:hypothetical protein